MNQITLSIHAAMLADKVRNEKLAEAIKKVVRKGDIVVDVGAGSGLLSMIAAKAGAKHVYAIECTEMAIAASQLIELNGFSDNITVVRDTLANWNPPELANVVISETMGFAGYEEGFRVCMIDARQRLLAAGGTLLPSAVKIMLVPVSGSFHKVDQSSLKNIMGFNFSPLATAFQSSLQRCYIPYEDEMAKPVAVINESCHSMKYEEYISGIAEFTSKRSGMISGFALWFNAQLTDGIDLDSRCPELDNHWGQTYLPLAEEISIKKGMNFKVKIKMRDASQGFFVEWDIL